MSYSKEEIERNRSSISSIHRHNKRCHFCRVDDSTLVLTGSDISITISSCTPCSLKIIDSMQKELIKIGK
jgi:hypothetical protein